jgi:hypothetical protein
MKNDSDFLFKKMQIILATELSNPQQKPTNPNPKVYTNLWYAYMTLALHL